MSNNDLFGSADPTASYGAVTDGAPLPRMLEFRGHDGRLLAIPYGRLVSIALDDDSGIELEFSNHRIVLRGRNLARLYDVLVENRATFVQEGDLDFVSESDTFVDSIMITPTDTAPEAGS